MAPEALRRGTLRKGVGGTGRRDGRRRGVTVSWSFSSGEGSQETSFHSPFFYLSDKKGKRGKRR
jgi:hypothetical protein